MDTVQDTLIEDLLESSDDNEMLQALGFMRDNGVPLTKHQAIGSFMLKEYGLSDIADFVNKIRVRMTPVSLFFKLVDKFTLADRIKGNAKLSNLLKANANPANASGIPMGFEKGVK